MECLVKNYSWMDDLAKASRVDALKSKDENFKAKYDRRETIGDIIEVREDGYWSDPTTGKGYRKDRFDLVCCPGEDLTGMADPLTEEVDGERVVVKKRGHSIDLSTLDKTKKIELSKVNFDSRKTKKVKKAK